MSNHIFIKEKQTKAVVGCVTIHRYTFFLLFLMFITFYEEIAIAFIIDKMLVCYEVINFKLLNVKCDENGLQWKMASSQKFCGKTCLTL